MSRHDTNNDSMNNLLNEKNIDLENYRKLVKSYIDLVSFIESDKITNLKRNHEHKTTVLMFSAFIQCCFILG